MKQEEGESKKRVRKTEDIGRRNSVRVEDPLEAPVLTRKVWDEVYEIFKLHFSTEMPFLHPPTFRNRMRQAWQPKDPSASQTELQDGKLLLLGVLTLTARFHPDLIAYHSQPSKPTHPLDASEYYATALKTAFGPTGPNLTNPSIDGIQTLLMLGLYEWGQTRGLSAWVYVGIAMRLAQSMGLAYEDDSDNRTFKLTFLRKNAVDVRQSAIDKEVRRRTLWSCFVMDRMLSAGKYRPTMISAKQLKVQLPCSDDQFLFVHDVQTGFLDSPPQSRENVNDDGVLSRYIRLVEIFGKFSEWSYAGGRRTEGENPPWASSTQFFQLRRELDEFHKALPSNLTFTEANLSAHIEKRNATTYASMHTLYSLCLIMLHREYIPFIPLRCKKPQGPLDAPIFPETQYHIPPGFWEESAEAIFKAAKDIVDIVRTCQDNNALPESPQIGFAVWQAAFVCVYATHFKHMDTGEHLHQGSGHNASDYRTEGYAGLTVKLLGEMVPRLEMAKGYLKTLGKMHNYFSNVKAEYHDRGFERLGGGLEQYKTLEKELKEFGSLQDTDKNIASDGSDTVDQVRSRASTNDIGQGSVNGEAMQGVVEAAPTPRPWAAINSTSPSNENEERKYNFAQGYQYNPNYQQSPTLNSNPPSLISPSNGESTPGINSPYAQNQSYQSSGQQQHVSAYATTVAHHPLAMAPPGTQAGEMRQWPEVDNLTWITYQERIGMNGYDCDNLAQQQGYGPYGDSHHALPTDMQNCTDPGTFMEILWSNAPTPVEVDQRWG